MGRKYAIIDQEGLYFVIFTVVNWTDVFVRNEYEQIPFCWSRFGESEIEIFRICNLNLKDS